MHHRWRSQRHEQARARSGNHSSRDASNSVGKIISGPPRPALFHLVAAVAMITGPIRGAGKCEGGVGPWVGPFIMCALD
jgi:hypothetical protein